MRTALAKNPYKVKNMINKEFDLSRFKQKSSKVSGYLKSKGHEIPKSTLYHALSLMFDENNWNTLKAKLEKNEVPVAIKKENNIETETLVIVQMIYNIYMYFFDKLFIIEDEHLFREEIISIAEKINEFNYGEYIQTKDFFYFIECQNDSSLLSQAKLIGDEDILKISLLDNIENGSELDLITKILLMLTTPGNLTSSTLNNHLSRKSITIERMNERKKKNYIFIFFDESEISERLNNRRNVSISGSASGGSLNYNKIIPVSMNQQQEDEEPKKINKTTKIQVDFINLNDNRDELKKFVLIK